MVKSCFLCMRTNVKQIVWSLSTPLQLLSGSASRASKKIKIKINICVCFLLLFRFESKLSFSGEMSCGTLIPEFVRLNLNGQELKGCKKSIISVH